MQSLGESSSVVERCLAKAKAEGSTPFFRFFKVMRLWYAVVKILFYKILCKNWCYVFDLFFLFFFLQKKIKDKKHTYKENSARLVK